MWINPLNSQIGIVNKEYIFNLFNQRLNERRK